MGYRIAADTVLVVHLSFILFTVAGGFLAWRWPRVIWAHWPVALWGVVISFVGFRCPLTPLENHLRRLAGAGGYDGGFIDNYLVSVIYPPGLTTQLQIGLGLGVIVLTVVAYRGYYARWTSMQRPARPSTPAPASPVQVGPDASVTPP